MVLNESERLTLMRRLGETIGEQEAATLMNSLPPYQWPEVATKAHVDAKIDELRAEMTLQFAKQTRTMVFMTVGFAISVWMALLIPAIM